MNWQNRSVTWQSKLCSRKDIMLLKGMLDLEKAFIEAREDEDKYLKSRGV